MRNVLIVVDDAGGGEAAARKVALLARSNEVGTIHLLNVQPRFNGHIARFLDRATIQGFRREEGSKALARARAVLDQAGLPYTAHVAAGSAAETIAAMAGELRVDSIVMAADGLGYLDHLMLRVLVARVLRLVDVPLLLVKTPKPAELGRWSPAFSR